MENELEVKIGKAIVPEKVIDAYKDLNALVAYVRRKKGPCAVLPPAKSYVCQITGIEHGSEASLVLGILEKYFEENL